MPKIHIMIQGQKQVINMIFQGIKSKFATLCKKTYNTL